MAKEQTHLSPKWRITYHPRHVTIIPKPSRYKTRSLNLRGSNPSIGLNAQHKGIVSSNAARKIRTAIDWLLASADTKYLYSKKTGKYHPWQINFCTLTLPTQGNKSDKQIKQILNAWLQVAKYEFDLKSYIWKAEPQKRGTIHIHLTSDCFMWHKKVRFTWNRLLKKHGLLNGHEDPNSTDIHSTYKIKNMSAYLCKYFTKGKEGERTIEGRLWGCSRSLSKARGIRFEMDWAEKKNEEYFLLQDSVKRYAKDFCDSYYMKNDWYKSLQDCELKRLFDARRRLIRKKKLKDQFEVYSMETGEFSSVNKIP